MKSIIGALSLLGILISLTVIIGTAGAVDCNELEIIDAAKRFGICVAILILSIIGIAKTEQEEDIYGRL